MPHMTEAISRLHERIMSEPTISIDLRVDEHENQPLVGCRHTASQYRERGCVDPVGVVNEEGLRRLERGGDRSGLGFGHLERSRSRDGEAVRREQPLELVEESSATAPGGPRSRDQGNSALSCKLLRLVKHFEVERPSQHLVHSVTLRHTARLWARSCRFRSGRCLSSALGLGQDHRPRNLVARQVAYRQPRPT